MSTATPQSSFQATDLQRKSREVLDAARTPEGALIRDKDGTNLLVVPAVRVSVTEYVLAGQTAALRVLRLVSEEPAPDPLLYGNLGWLTVLPPDMQRTFAWEYVRALQAVPSTGIGPVDDLLYDWQQTARAWSDEQLRAELTAPIDEPAADAAL